MRVTRLVVLMAAASLIACGDREETQTQATTPPLTPTPIDTVEQQRTYAPQTGLPSNPKAPPGTVGDGTVGDKVQVEIKNNKLTLSQKTMAPGPVTISFNNTDEQRHIIEIRYVPGGRWRSVPVGKGGSVVMAQSLNVGEYEIYCFVPGHKEKGEKTTFVVQ